MKITEAQKKKALKYFFERAKTKTGESIPKDKNERDVSSISLYYMLDKDSWQLKAWLYPTNKSKTFNLAIKENDLSLWVQVFKVEFSFGSEKIDEWSLDNE